MRESLHGTTAVYEDLDQFFHGVFGHLDEMTAELIRRQEAWVAERAEIQSQLEQRGRKVDELTEELARGHAELAEARREIEQQRAAMSALQAQRQSAPDEGLSAQWEQQRAQLQQERSELEHELETVRNRAAELAEALAEQKREMSDQQTAWAEELRRMRRLMETMVERQLANTSAAPPPPAEKPAASEPAIPSGDPALDSVMAQFEMLQRDVARRRKRVAGVS